MIRTSNSVAPEIGIHDIIIHDIIEDISTRNYLFKTSVCLVGGKNKQTKETTEKIMRELKQGLIKKCPDRNIIVQEKFPEEFQGYREAILNSMINLKILLPFSEQGDFISNAAVLKNMISEITDN